jgi:hypothetical protein
VRRKLNDSAAQPIPIYFVDDGDGKTPVNNPTNAVVYIRKNGGTSSSAAGTIAVAGPSGGARGWHWWTPTEDDLDTLGPVSAVAEADGCDPFPFVFEVEALTVADELARIRRIGTPSAFVLTPVNDAGDVLIYVGADNLASLANAWTLPIESALDLDGGAFTITLGVGPKDGAALFTIAGVATATGVDAYDVVFQPTKTENGGLAVYAEYGYTVLATDAGGNEAVLAEGLALTRRKWG